jgi:preprotein translocase subunit SecB
MLHFSGINICVNSLRNIIATVTANGLFGKYTLPSIDVNQLIADKNQLSEKQNQPK